MRTDDRIEALNRILDLALEEPQTRHTQRGIAVITANILHEEELLRHLGTEPPEELPDEAA